MMQRLEQKSETPKTLLQLLEEQVCNVEIRDNNVAYLHLNKSDPASAQLIADKLKKIPIEQFFISLNPREVDVLWGKNSYHILKRCRTSILNNAEWTLRKIVLKSLTSHPALYPILTRLRARGYVSTLMAALTAQSQDACLKLIHDLSTVSFKFAIHLKDNPNLKECLSFLRSLPPDIGMKMVELISEAEWNQMLRLCDQMHLFADTMLDLSPSVCLKLIDRISNKGLNAALQVVDGFGFSAFERALSFKPPEVCFNLVYCIEGIVLDALLEREDVHGDRGCFRAAAELQTESVFSALVRKASPRVLARAACQLYPKDMKLPTPIEIACQYQTALSLQAFFQCLLHPLAKVIMCDFFRENIQKLVSCFTLLAQHQTVENADVFLSILDDDLLKEMQEFIRRDIDSYPVRALLRVLQYKMEYCVNDSVEYTADEKPFSVLRLMPNLVVYKAEEKLLSARRFLTNLFELLPQNSKLKPRDAKEPTANYSERDKTALTLFSAGAFVKIVREDKKEHNAEFIAHLFHPEKRHAIRTSKVDKSWGYKLLLTPQVDKAKKENKREEPAEIYYSYPGGFPSIIKVRNVDQHVAHKKQKPPHTLSTKHPVSYISKNLHTGLFGYESREMVGYAFTVNQNNIKLLSTQDCGTVRRWWYGSGPVLVGAANHSYHFICRTFAEFVKRVDDQPYVVNEVLVKLSTQDLFSIVIGKDTPKAREIAIKRRLELRRLFKRDLPILFYYHEEQKAMPYTSDEQTLNHASLFLTELQESIQQQVKPSGLKGLFSFTPSVIRVDFNDASFQIDARLANVILEIIKTKKPEHAFSEITKTLQVTKKQVSALGFGKTG